MFAAFDYAIEKSLRSVVYGKLRYFLKGTLTDERIVTYEDLS